MFRGPATGGAINLGFLWISVRDEAGLGATRLHGCVKAATDDRGIEKDDRLHKVCCFASAYVAKEIMCEQWSYEGDCREGY
ncbi:hypothetical protein [Sphingobium sp. Sx8-8]|uniref:hypothetical protein n=1 Tax=Sphingobium sp. Sx8-8 TaxID=2933617 RepID=UPI001F5A5D37|nr:hypothetical protein [Sphingobium sp. Sx8-8]